MDVIWTVAVVLGWVALAIGCWLLVPPRTPRAQAAVERIDAALARWIRRTWGPADATTAPEAAIDVLPQPDAPRCPMCEGDGAVIRVDGPPGHMLRQCPWCSGTGRAPQTNGTAIICDTCDGSGRVDLSLGAPPGVYMPRDAPCMDCGGRGMTVVVGKHR